VAKAAVAAGASIINDISALRFDPKMAEVAAEYEVPLILMHMKGTPGTMQVAPEYDDLIGEIRDFFENAMAQAVTAGVSKSKLIIDPGIGFGKTLEHNLRLIRQLHEFECLNAPILMGPSRKAFIRNILKNETGREITPDLPEVEIGTQSAVAASVLNGAHIVRVHHVANTFATVRLIDAIKNQHE
jgi:dihydropteroate synthase